MILGKQNSKIYEEIVKETIINETITDNDSKFLNVDFTDLLKENSDTKGWINFNDINYPFLQSKDNEYYLKKSFDKKYNINGSLFVDYRNNDFTDFNTVIYGHNMKDNQMFGSLKQLLEKEYFTNNGNDIIKISTVLANYNFKIISVYVIEDEDYYVTTSFTKTEFKEFINTIIKRSYYNFEPKPLEQDKLLTLSTCNGYNGTNKRLVVHAKLIETELR